MAKYILLRIEDDDEADDLLRDMARYPHDDLLTPVQENTVHAEVVPDVDPGDDWSSTLGVGAPRTDYLARLLRESYERAGELAAALEAEL